MIGGLYGQGLHDLLMRELEVGLRVALAEEDESLGFGPLFDVIVSRDLACDDAAYGCLGDDLS